MNIIDQYKDRLYKRLFRTIDVPEDLRAITDIDVKQEVDPNSVGLDSTAIETIWQAAENLYRTGVHPMLSLCVRRKGQIVINRSLGYARQGVAATVNTPVCLFSASKAVSSLLIHLLEEQGKIHLLDPISYYLPEFAAKGKSSITVLQLLSHRGGIPNLPEGVDMHSLLDHKATIKILCEAEPTDRRNQAYHAVTSGFIMDELIRVTTGLNIQQYLDRYIKKPMGMRYFRYGLTKRDQSKVAHDKVTGPDIGVINRALEGIIGVAPDEIVDLTNSPLFYETVFASANLFATAEECSRFFQMLLNHGEWQGKKILDPLTVHKATHALGKAEFDKTLMAPMRYSAGYMLGGAPYGIFGPNSHHAYGHLGYANISCWADPQRDIAVSIMNNGKLIVGPHLKSFFKLIGAIAGQCSPVVDMKNDMPAYQHH
jgi:CubicO group peptidase (beta-lactamase class C family)